MGSNESKVPKKAPPTIDEMVIELKMNAKMLQRESTKTDKERKKNIVMAEKCLKKGDEAGARVYCKNAEQNKANAEKYLKTSAQLEGLSATIRQNTRVQEVMSKAMMVMPGILNTQANYDVKELYGNIEKFNQAMDTVKVNNAMANDAYTRIEEKDVEENADNLFTQLKNDVIYKNMKEGDVMTPVVNKQTNQAVDDNLNDFIRDLKK